MSMPLSCNFGPKLAIFPSNMAVVRILVDGYSLLQQWPALAPGKPRTSEAAREELIARLTRYHDVSGIPITVIFQGSAHDLGPFPSTPAVEVVFAPTQRSAEQLIERVCHRMKTFGEVLVVRDTPNSASGTISSCANFIHTLEHALSELEQDLSQYNQKERLKFTSGRIP